MKVLLSIKPEFVQRIMSGEKQFEYRKKMFKENVESVVVYSTKPVGKIVGEFTIDSIINDSPKQLWDSTCEYSGISRKFFMKYFQKRDEGFALKIKKFFKYNEPIDPDLIFDNFVAPQSFRYIDDELLEKFNNITLSL